MDPGAGPQVGLGVGEELVGAVVNLEDRLQDTCGDRSGFTECVISCLTHLPSYM